MGWSQKDFYLSTPAFFFLAYDGFAEQQQLEWERARYISFHAIQPLKAHANKWKINRLTDIGLFPWEKEQAKKIKLSPEELQKVSGELDAMISKKYQMVVTTPEA